MPVCGCSSGEGCVRKITLNGTKTSVLRIMQRWHDAQSSTAPGIGVALWESGVALIRHLELSPTLVRGKRVLELGCGTGAVAIACAMLGAKHVVATDVDEACLALTRQNAEENLQDVPGCLTVEEHSWGSDHTLGSFDVILGADILYDARSFAALELDLVSCASERCRIMLAYPCRPEANPEGLLGRLETVGGFRVRSQSVSLDEGDASQEAQQRWASRGLVLCHVVRGGATKRPRTAQEETCQAAVPIEAPGSLRVVQSHVFEGPPIPEDIEKTPVSAAADTLQSQGDVKVGDGITIDVSDAALSPNPPKRNWSVW